MTAPEAKRFGIDDVETRKAHVQLVATKGNELPPDAFAPIWLVRGAGGVLSAAELKECAVDQDQVGQRETKALSILKDMTNIGTASVMAWGRECAVRGLLSGTPQAIEKAIHRIKKMLLANGLIEPGLKRGVFVPVVDEL